MSYSVLLKTCCGGIRKERKAGGAITPGHLIAVNSSDAVVVHATAGGKCRALFALEDELQGKGIADAYAQDAIVQYNVCAPGDEVNALLKANENIAIGDPLTSAGDGTLKKATLTSTANTGTGAVAQADHVVAYAAAASNTNAVVRIPVEIA